MDPKKCEVCNNNTPEYFCSKCDLTLCSLCNTNVHRNFLFEKHQQFLKILDGSIDSISYPKKLPSKKSETRVIKQGDYKCSKSEISTCSKSVIHENTKDLKQNQGFFLTKEDSSALKTILNKNTTIKNSYPPIEKAIEEKETKKENSLFIIKCYVGNLNYKTTENNLKDYFSRYFNVIQSEIVYDRSGHSKGYGFVTISFNQDKSQTVIQKLNNRMLDQRKIKIVIIQFSKNKLKQKSSDNKLNKMKSREQMTSDNKSNKRKSSEQKTKDKQITNNKLINKTDIRANSLIKTFKQYENKIINLEFMKSTEYIIEKKKIILKNENFETLTKTKRLLLKYLREKVIITQNIYFPREFNHKYLKRHLECNISKHYPKIEISLIKRNFEEFITVTGKSKTINDIMGTIKQTDYFQYSEKIIKLKQAGFIKRVLFDRIDKNLGKFDKKQVNFSIFKDQIIITGNKKEVQNIEQKIREIMKEWQTRKNFSFGNERSQTKILFNKLKSQNYKLINQLQSKYGVLIKLRFETTEIELSGFKENIESLRHRFTEIIKNYEKERKIINISILEKPNFEKYFLTFFFLKKFKNRFQKKLNQKNQTINFDSEKQVFILKTDPGDQNTLKSFFRYEMKLFLKKIYKETIEISPLILRVILQNKNEFVYFSNTNRILIEFPKTHNCEYRYQFENKETLFEINSGDILDLSADAIVNYRNEKLSNLKGLAGVISKETGKQFDMECEQYIKNNKRLLTGNAMMTGSGDLANYNKVINVVLPMWDNKKIIECKRQLAKAYNSVIQIANNNNLTSIVFPIIGVAGYHRALDILITIALEQIKRYFLDEYSNKNNGNTSNQNSLRQITFCNKCQLHFSKLVTQAKNLFGNSNVSLDFDYILPKVNTNKNNNINQNKYLWSWYKDSGKYELYSQENQTKINREYQNNNKSAKLIIGNKKYLSGVEYSIVFGTMQQINNKTSFVRKVKKVLNEKYAKDQSQEKVNTCSNIEKENQNNQTMNNYIQNINSSQKLKIYGMVLNNNYKRNSQRIITKINRKIEKHSYKEKIILRNLKIENINQIINKYHLAFHIVEKEKKIIEIVGKETNVLKAKYDLEKSFFNSLSCNFPNDWTSDPKGNVTLQSISKYSSEWNRIQTKVHQTLTSVELIEIERVENHYLWKIYQDSKNRMLMKNLQVNELELFHGSRETIPEKIHSEDTGFDMRISKKGMWGKGIYFAVNASYSNHYAHIKTKSSSFFQKVTKQFFLAKVLVGDSITMAHTDSLVRPPIKNTSQVLQNQIIRHDSVNGVTQGSKVYIIYQNDQAYPYYLITYR
ncbi:protein mono-adp-ribosyltransferase parp15 [Anaeramoeba flamelloides]|uniref:Poly [ADP-ribose] polymerase n=1 Tax=Anaeramoeba flamelloides TaxID=1746091 RepID=A0ABQ8Z905_9EUKA|nr:protein mono-adp-ribosyltransferase parp15 [Anaeramoeba flamelloides]